MKGVAARREGKVRGQTRRHTAWLFGWFKESSVRLVYFAYFSFPFFSFLPVPLVRRRVDLLCTRD